MRIAFGTKEMVDALNTSVQAPNGNRYGWPVFKLTEPESLMGTQNIFTDENLTDHQMGYALGFAISWKMARGEQ